MNNENLIKKNIELSAEFGKYLLDNPDIAAKIPPEAAIVFLDETDPELTEYNLALSKEALKQGKPVVKVHIKGLAPETTRLLEPHLEFAGK